MQDRHLLFQGLPGTHSTQKTGSFAIKAVFLRPPIILTLRRLSVNPSSAGKKRKKTSKIPGMNTPVRERADVAVGEKRKSAGGSEVQTVNDVAVSGTQPRDKLVLPAGAIE
jgi:hypothetical protein